MPLEKIISGGQTGVDRGALDAALDAHFPCGGSCPAERAAEDGMIPPRYPLTPLPEGGYRERTLQNVLDSDGTVLICTGVLSGGTRLTRDFCQQHAKPHLVIDASLRTESIAAIEIANFIRKHGIGVLNVAGARASDWRQAHQFAYQALFELLRNT
jgi:Circularly permutated YpsA SLOG family